MNDSLKINDTGEVDNTSYIVISTFTWKIKNFSVMLNDMKVEEIIESPVLSAKTNLESKFKLWMYPKGKKKSEEHVGLYLMSYNETATEMNYKFSLLDNENKENYEFQNKAVFNQNDFGWGRLKFVQISELLNKKNQFYVDDVLRISCELKINMNSACNKQPSDVKIIVDSWEFHAHKNILAANSTVFAAMFQHDMKENQQNLVTIEDIKRDAIDVMLQFIYLKEIKLGNSTMMDLLVAADKYAIGELKIKCENKLCEEITVDNALEYLDFAHFRNLIKLKVKAIDFIKLQGRQMIINKKFDSITDLSKDMLIELFSALLPQEK